MKWWWMSVAVGATFLAALAFKSRPESAPSGSSKHSVRADLRGQVQALRAKVEGLQAHVDALRKQVAVIREDMASSATTTAVAPALRAPTASLSDTSEVLEANAEEQQELFSSLEARLESEPVDAEWSTHTVREIREVAAANLPRTRLDGVECGASMCRVAFHHDSREDQLGIGRTLGRLPPFSTGAVYDYDFESDPPKTTLFLVRPGSEFREESAYP
ncbi:MAG TPA: hypothetical protein VFS67_06200 [Polyangiaceae bacterium]|nr:hypothetical protein [Polyangiaceae bacterium]